MGSVGLEGLVKSYGAVQVVHGIDREVAEKDFVVQVGPSDCGKPTTLWMIAGLEEITAGDLTIDNRRMNWVASKDRDVTMGFQNYALYRRPADLSCGQRQRVATGCAIVRHPKVFLFDELLSHSDAKLRTQMRAKIKRLPMQREGAEMTMARGLAKELGTDMRVNAFYPSMIDTDFGNIHTLDTGRRGFEANAPLKRQGHVDDLANFVLFLTCDDSAFFTGTNIDLNGGMLLS